MSINHIPVKTLIVALLFFGLRSNAATVDTALTYSAAMHKNIKAVVVKPDDYSTSKKFPTVYLLHGAGGKYSDWVTNVPDKQTVQKLADLYDIIVVCPDGNVTSWYFDSPVDPAYKYETYISSELVTYIDSHYATIKDRSKRAITGLSMGGHGALYLAFRHQDVFGACGSMSGGVDLTPFPDNWDLAKRLGKYSEYPKRWEENSVINMIYLLTPDKLAITFDCGSSDFFYQVNKNLHEALLEHNIPHDFTVRPGAHTWEYWGNSINYQMLFFSRFFKK
ncbi:S-formylglutathione hydrolase FrmB [Mucilaginibacter mallensis]|uniref:S-formylglutathione hydrolase FrmB n=1 Tax=Mucilaginibacter mallensis TaxID=652787 RepID=A0A1H1PU25_MUCMA|nr:alpha/beta hydrolase family protein [Mucilaginibacter mallensis]SDS14593.1 S-formylglutathione hydrolase FrmB [Mucilaginibacter mallensis]